MTSWPDWSGEWVACVATGPSLRKEQLSAIRGRARVIAINDAGLPNRLPFNAAWCDLWYAADLAFWSFNKAVLEQSDAIRVCAMQEARDAGLVDLHLNTSTLNRGVGYARSGGHSGFQALQLAMNSGATLVTLHGYDCKPAAVGPSNYFGEKSAHLFKASPYQNWVPLYRSLNPRCRVFNCTPGSAIDAFPFADVQEIFAEDFSERSQA